MPVHGDDRASVQLRAVLAYLAKIRPLLQLWEDTFDPEAAGACWSVGKRLTELWCEAAKMTVPDHLLDVHEMLVLDAFAPAVLVYLAILHGEPPSRRADLHSAALAGMDTFQKELHRQVVALVDKVKNISADIAAC